MKKKMFLFGLLTVLTGFVYAQKDSVLIVRSNDTVRIGGVIILKDGDSTHKNRIIVSVGENKTSRKPKVRTSAFIIDLGFSNWVDNTNYATAVHDNYLVNRPGSSEIAQKDFSPRAGKSINVDIWVAAQKVSLINDYLNLKYAIGFQLNNYRFKSNISFSDGGLNPYDPTQDINHAFVFRDSVQFSKNKLAADYITVPLLLNFNTNPNDKDFGLSLSAGVSVGVLFSSRNKQISDEHGKMKDHGTYDMRKWKFSYEADLGVGKIVSLYGSYTPKSIFRNELDFQPYTVGLRFLTGNW